MTDWYTVFLGIIAVSTGVMALIQVGAIVMGLRLAARVNELTRQVQHEIRPTLAKLVAISDDAARVSAKAVTQAERVDRLFGDVTTRVERAASRASHAMRIPARESSAVVSAVRAALASVRATKSRRKRLEREAADRARFVA